MPRDISSLLNAMETRIAALEQVNTRATRQVPELSADPTTGVMSVTDPLDWTVGGWASYSQLTPNTDPLDPDYGTAALSSPYEMAQAHRLGSWCILTGMVRRKTGNLVANTNYRIGGVNEQPMFALPMNWRPTTRTMLPCTMGNSDPTTGGVTSTSLAWVEVVPRTDRSSGMAYYVSGHSDLTAGTGWVTLSGMFPLLSVDYTPPPSGDSWDLADSWVTWDAMEDGITWDSYPGFPAP